jgi:hypothetical protein
LFVIRLFTAGGRRFPQLSFIGCLAVFFIFTALAVFGQDVESAITKTLEKSRYSEGQKASIITFFVETGRVAIPAELLVPKLEEGIAKRIPAQRVLDALKQEREGLLKARALILRVEGGEQVLADRASWARTANLLAGGISETEVEGLILLCRSRVKDFRPATYLYVALKEWGLGREPSFSLIGALLSSSISTDSFMGVMDLLATGRRRRIAPEELVQRIEEHLKHVKTIEELEKWIY